MSAEPTSPHNLLESLALGEMLAQSQRIGALEARVAELSRRVAELERQKQRRTLWPWIFLAAGLVALLLVVGL
mgnify:FL=1